MMPSYQVDADRQHAVVHQLAPCGHPDSETRSIRTTRGLVTYAMCPVCAAQWDEAWLTGRLTLRSPRDVA